MLEFKNSKIHKSIIVTELVKVTKLEQMNSYHWLNCQDCKILREILQSLHACSCCTELDSHFYYFSEQFADLIIGCVQKPSHYWVLQAGTEQDTKPHKVEQSSSQAVTLSLYNTHHRYSLSSLFICYIKCSLSSPVWVIFTYYLLLVFCCGEEARGGGRHKTFF